MPTIFLDFFWLSTAEKTIGCFFGLFKLGHGLTTYKAYNSLMNNTKIYEKIFSDSKKPELFHGAKFLGYHFSVIYKKLHKHSHWGTQETLTVTQETLK